MKNIILALILAIMCSMSASAAADTLFPDEHSWVLTKEEKTVKGINKENLFQANTAVCHPYKRPSFTSNP